MHHLVLKALGHLGIYFDFPAREIVLSPKKFADLTKVTKVILIMAKSFWSCKWSSPI